MLEVRDLKAPLDVQRKEEKAAERASLFLKSRLKRLGKSQVSKIERKLDKWYTAWKDQTKTQRQRLVRYFDLMEGTVEDSNAPFEGASNVTLHYAAGIARTFDATFNKTSYYDEDIFYAILSPSLRKKIGDNKTIVKELEEAFNFSFWGSCNGLKTLKEGTIPCVRDGTLVVSGRWFREIRHCFDQRVYRSEQTFLKDYPDPETAGITREEYQDIIDFFLAHGSESNQQPNPMAPPPPNGQGPTGGAFPAQGAGMPAPVSPGQPEKEKEDTPELIVVYEYDHVYKNEPEYRVGPWAKFVRYPLTSSRLDECLMYGYQLTEDRESVKLKGFQGEYYERGVEKALAGKEASSTDGWDKALGFVEGITQPTGNMDKAIRPIDGCFLMDLDEDGIPEKYQFKYDPESKALLSLTPHRLPRGIDASVAFKMVKRENRLEGVSLIGDCEDLFNQVDFNVRHRNNVRILTTSPIFLANQKYKDVIDLGRAENVIRPGVTYWVDDPSGDKAIRQLQIQDLSQTMDNMDELRLYKEHVELVFGPTQGMSGSSTPQDPRAPARKTQMLMQQAGGRIDRYIDQFMESLPDLAKVHAALLCQYAEGPDISYTKGDKTMNMPVELLADPGLMWGVKRRSVQLTPEFTMARLAALQQSWMQLLPRIAVGDPIAMEVWNRIVLASGEPQADKFILEGDNLQKIQQSFQAAMQMNLKNPETVARNKGKEAFHKEMGREAAKRLTGQISPVGA